MTPTEAVLVDQAKDVTALALTWPEKARAVAVVDDSTYGQAAEMLLGVKALRGQVDEAFDGIISKAFAAHREACSQKKKAEGPLVEAEAVLKLAMGTYTTAQERKRLEEVRRRQEEERRSEETRRIEEAAAKEREAKASGDEELLAEAHELIEAPIITAPVYVPPVVKAAGISTRENWSASVTNIRLLIAFVAAHPEHTNLLQSNTTALNSLARAMKANLKIPGVAVVNNPVVSARR